MNEAQAIMSESDLSHLAGEYEAPPTADDVIQMSGDLLAIVALSQQMPVDFEGCEITVLREQGTNRLKALILSPVDLHGDEPFARYQVNPSQTARAKGPSIVMPN